MLALAAGVLNYTERQAQPFLPFANLSLTDPENHPLFNATVTITAGCDAGDVLSAGELPGTPAFAAIYAYPWVPKGGGGSGANGSSSLMPECTLGLYGMGGVGGSCALLDNWRLLLSLLTAAAAPAPRPDAVDDGVSRL